MKAHRRPPPLPASGRAVRGNWNDSQRYATASLMQSTAVMAGLVPAIHAAPLHEISQNCGPCSAWMPGTRPGMTRCGCAARGKRAGCIFPDSPALAGRGGRPSRGCHLLSATLFGIVVYSGIRWIDNCYIPLNIERVQSRAPPHAARAGGPAASSAATSSSVKTRLRVRKRTPSGASSEKPEPRPGTTSMMSWVCCQ